MAYSGRTDQLDAHRRSPEFRAQCSAQMKKINAERMAFGPRCGARRRRDGEPCQQMVLFPNGRCRFHGGKTPKGKQWHKVQYPKARAPYDDVIRKQRDVAKRQKKRAQARAEKLAAMTPEQRAKYDAQFAKRVMTPGPLAARIRARNARDQAKWIRELLEQPAKRRAAGRPPRAAKAPRQASTRAPDDPKQVAISIDKLRELFP